MGNTLEKTVSENVEAARVAADKRARENGEAKIDKQELARRVAFRLDPKQAGDPKEGAKYIEKTYDRIRASRAGKQRWTIELIEAVASSLGTVPSRLVAEDYSEGKVPTADRGEFLARNLGRRLTPSEVSQTVKGLSIAKEAHDGSWALIWKIFEDVRSAKTGAEAASKTHDRVLKWWDKRDKSAGTQRKSKTGK